MIISVDMTIGVEERFVNLRLDIKKRRKKCVIMVGSALVAGCRWFLILKVNISMLVIYDNDDYIDNDDDNDDDDDNDNVKRKWIINYDSWF